MEIMYIPNEQGQKIKVTKAEIRARVLISFKYNLKKKNKETKMETEMRKETTTTELQTKKT